jgi:hypothetical protein
MTATELEEVQALLERVLPDARGFAGRLLQQAVTQYGLLAEPAATAYYSAGEAEDVASEETVIVAEEWAADRAPVDTNILLAAALGACGCWGLRADCGVCQGQGSAGWTQPDPELFDEFVRPALDRLPAVPRRDRTRPAGPGTDHDHDDHQPCRERTDERDMGGRRGI